MSRISHHTISLLCALLLCINTNAQSVDIRYDSATKGPSSFSKNEERVAVTRGVPDSVVESYKNDKDFEYANDPAYWARPKQKSSANWDGIFNFFASDLFKAFIYLILAAIIIYIIYRVIVVNQLFVLSRSRTRRMDDATEDHDSINESTLDSKLNHAISQNDYRSAVRFLYLKTLYGLNGRNLINMHADATNEEYLQQLKEHKLFGDFKFLTRIYEYVWYGEFNITHEQFSVAHNGFKKFQDKLF
jgi:hypothetical protein